MCACEPPGPGVQLGVLTGRVSKQYFVFRYLNFVEFVFLTKNVQNLRRKKNTTKKVPKSCVCFFSRNFAKKTAKLYTKNWKTSSQCGETISNQFISTLVLGIRDQTRHLKVGVTIYKKITQFRNFKKRKFL